MKDKKDELITLTFNSDGTLDRLPKLDAIALGLFADERPLKGVTGFVDWRLHGMLSRLVLAERLSGAMFESCLVPARGRLPMEKVFVFGLGDMEELSVNRFTRLAGELISTMSKAQAYHYAVSIWDLTRGRVAPEEAAGIFFRQLLADRESRQDAAGSNRMITFVERGPWGKALKDGFRLIAERPQELPVRLEIR